ncbi:hypothetical protein QJS04_geneDACA022162 [Acorus gramineus]|uniref:Uncharacterized protein n=1 Tax=Acorus gramineus TaxID=55184 RepID=A0AAV9BMZ5_ACOGR|nr:hypothetical protein QJS04_geneDACA022162 [Acorus gramineus]
MRMDRHCHRAEAAPTQKQAHTEKKPLAFSHTPSARHVHHTKHRVSLRPNQSAQRTAGKRSFRATPSLNGLPIRPHSYADLTEKPEPGLGNQIGRSSAPMSNLHVARQIPKKYSKLLDFLHLGELQAPPLRLAQSLSNSL